MRYLSLLALSGVLTVASTYAGSPGQTEGSLELIPTSPRTVGTMRTQQAPVQNGTPIGGALMQSTGTNGQMVNMSSISTGLQTQRSENGPMYVTASKSAYAGIYTVGLTTQSPGYVTTIPLSGSAPAGYDRLVNLNGNLAKGAYNDADNWVHCFNPGGTTLMMFFYNMSDWSMKGPTYPPYSPSQSNTYEVFDSAYDPIDGMVYGMMAKMSNPYGPPTTQTPEWSKVNPATGDRTVIAACTVAWRGIMCDQTGQFFGIDADGTLYKIDKNTGNSTFIGETGVASYYRTTGACDPRTGEIIYATCNDDGSALYRINPTTAAATKIYDFTQRVQLVNLTVPAPAAADDAPDTVTDVVVDFENGSLTGKVKFTAPTATYAGEPSHGDLFYYISANGVPVADGRTVYGDNVEREITLDRNDNYVFEIYCTNQVGPGPRVKTAKQFIGNDVPVPSYTFTIEYSNNQFNLSWGTPNTTGINGGTVDSSNVQYILTRYPDGKQIITGKGVTNYTDAYPEPEKGGIHYYTLKALYNGVESNDMRTSNKLLIGTIYPAYTNNFQSGDDKIGFTSEAITGPNDWGIFSNTLRLGYRSGEGRDNYLFTPKMYLYAGRNYRFSIKASQWMNTQLGMDKIEVLYGHDANKFAMTHTILADCQVTTYSQSSPNKFETMFVPEEDGYYYFCIHVTGPDNRVAFCLDDLEISSPINGGAPEQVGNLKATPAADGSLKAAVSFTTPKKNLLGKSLTQLTRVEIRKGDEVVADLPMTNETLTWTDKDATAGINSYTVTPYNNDGAGTPQSTSCFVGFDLPASVANITIKKGENTGEVEIEWTPVTQDIHGLSLPAVQYGLVRLANGEETLVDQGLTETTYTDKVTNGPQVMVLYGVKAITPEGISQNWATSEQILVGTPYPTPYEESVKNATLSTFVATRNVTNLGAWEIDDDSTFGDLRSVDYDNGYISYFSQYIDQVGELYSGLIQMPETMKNPTLSFYSYHFKNSTNTLEPMIQVEGETTWRVLDKIVLTDSVSAGWSLYTYDLTAWLGKTVQIGFRASINSHVIIPIDKIQIYSQLDKNIDNVVVSGPTSAAIGSDIQLTVGYDVNARKDAETVKVILMRDGKEIASKEVEKTEAGQHAAFIFDDKFPQIATANVNYTAKVEYAEDETPANNSSRALAVAAVIPEMPVAEDLAAVRSEDGKSVKLSWICPDMNKRPWQEYTESFEGVTTGQDHFEGWTFVDADKAPVGTAGAPDDVFPGIIAGESTAGFIGVNAAANSEMFGSAHSGDCFMGALYCYDRSVNDDWLISPELKGDAQIAKVWVRSMTDFYGGDRVEFLYSTKGTSLNDFNSLGGWQGIPPVWTELAVELPEGAKYLAIRCVSVYQLMFCVDDVTFVPKNANYVAMNLLGYNIWRDGEKINEEMIAANTPEYTDTTVDASKHTYHVTGLYDLGESAACDPAYVDEDTSAVDQITAASVKVSVEGNDIVVTGVADNDRLVITTIDGINIWNGKGNARVNVADGIYIVRAATVTAKVNVR